jgi:hypothetical protein
MSVTAFSTEGQIVNLAAVYYRSDRYNHHGYLRRRRGVDSFDWIPVEVAAAGGSSHPVWSRPARGGSLTSTVRRTKLPGTTKL